VRVWRVSTLFYRFLLFFREVAPSFDDEEDECRQAFIATCWYFGLGLREDDFQIRSKPHMCHYSYRLDRITEAHRQYMWLQCVGVRRAGDGRSSEVSEALSLYWYLFGSFSVQLFDFLSRWKAGINEYLQSFAWSGLQGRNFRWWLVYIKDYLQQEFLDSSTTMFSPSSPSSSSRTDPDDIG
jgi:hypothetical protein